MNYLLIYWWIAVSMDWSSTIEAHYYGAEENPLMRDIWKTHGDIGFTITSLLFGFLLHIVIVIGFKYGYKWSVISSALVMITFKILIALTNLAVIPYWVTGWFQF